jgi:hypothetical protein
MDKAAEYAVDCTERDRKPTITGFAIFCGLSMPGLTYYFNHKNREYNKVLSYIKTWIYEEKLQLAYDGLIDTKIFIFDGINHHQQINTRSTNDNKTALELSGKAGTTTTLAAVLESADSGGLGRRIGPSTEGIKQIPGPDEEQQIDMEEHHGMVATEEHQDQTEDSDQSGTSA